MHPNLTVRGSQWNLECLLAQDFLPRAWTDCGKELLAQAWTECHLVWLISIHSRYWCLILAHTPIRACQKRRWRSQLARGTSELDFEARSRPDNRPTASNHYMITAYHNTYHNIRQKICIIYITNNRNIIREQLCLLSLTDSHLFVAGSHITTLSSTIPHCS